MDDTWTTQDRARDLGEQLDIPASTYKGKEGPALNIMSRLAALQFISDHDQRQQAGNEILAYANRVFPMNDPDSAPFFRKVQETVATQQELPNFTNELSYSNDKLVDRYIDADRIVKGLGYAGVGGSLNAGKDALKGGLQGGQQDAGTLAQRGGNALRGAGSEVGSGISKLAGPVKGGPGIVYWGWPPQDITVWPTTEENWRSRYISDTKKEDCRLSSIKKPLAPMQRLTRSMANRMRAWVDIGIFWAVVVVATNIAWRLADPVYLFPIAIPIALCMLGVIRIVRMIVARLIRRCRSRAVAGPRQR